MRIICQTDFQPAVQVTQLGPGRYLLTAIVKGTFQLAPSSVTTLLKTQPFVCGDVPYDDAVSEQAPPRYSSDFVPWKPIGEVMLAGTCHVPGGNPLKTCQAGFDVASHKYRLQVFGNRVWRLRDEVLPTLPEPAPFAQQQLRYEYSFGGDDFVTNPVGRGYRKTPVGVVGQAWELPNIEDPAHLIAAPDSCPNPAGLGPLPFDWPQRNRKCGTYDLRWQQTHFPGYPDDLDWTIFNAAPETQWLDEFLRGDEQLRFLNLHPGHSDYVASLPRLRARCFVSRKSDPQAYSGEVQGKRAPNKSDVLPSEVIRRAAGDSYFHELNTNLDTLWIDMDAEEAVLIWRGITPIATDDYAEIEHLFVLTEELGKERQNLREYVDFFESQLERSKTASGLVSQLPGGLAASFPALPDVDEEIAKAESQMAELLADIVDSGETNEQLTAAFGDDAPALPQLAGLGLTAQLEAIDEFVDAVDSTARDAGHDKVSGMQQRQQPAVELDQPSNEDKQQVDALVQQIMRDEGIEEQIREADELVRETATEWYRSKINLAAYGVDLSALLLGLRGVGVDTDRLKKECGIDLGETAWTRERVEQQLAVGGAFREQLFVELDLSGFDMKGADFRDAILVKVKLVDADLSDADFSRAVISECDLTKCQLVRTKLGGANLCASILSNANLSDARLEDAVCGTAKIDHAKLVGMAARATDFAGSDFTGSCLDANSLAQADFSKCTLDGTSFRQADLTRAAFDEATGEGTDFTAADLSNVRASRGCKLPGAVFHQARLAGSNWSSAELSGADFSYARINGAFFIEAALAGGKLTAANLAGARLSKADLRGASLVDANLFQASLDKADLTGADLSRTNAYNADFLEAILDDAVLDGADTRMTLLSFA